MESPDWIIIVVAIVVTMWFVFVPYIVIVHMVHGLGFNLPARMVRQWPFGMPPRWYSLLLSIIFLTVYLIILAAIFKWPVIERIGLFLGAENV